MTQPAPSTSTADDVRPSAPLLLVPNGTAFLAGLCIMIVELLAGNVIAGFLGGSLYTWTSVIGVIMAGIAAGNYVGGRLADRFAADRLLGLLFLLSAAACATILRLNGLVGAALDGWDVTPGRIAVHVFAVFFVPGGLLGTMSPVIAKMALDRGLATGRTVGSVYAANAAGSIVGTFLTGFYLTPNFPTSRTIWTVAILLSIIGVCYLAAASVRRNRRANSA